MATLNVLAASQPQERHSDNYTVGANHAALLARSAISGLDPAYTSAKKTRGNVTGLSRRLIQDNNREITSYQQYDLAGNQLTDGAEPYPHTFTYDAENKIKTVDGLTAYVYNGEGQRVRKLVGERLRMVYGMSGELIVEYDDESGELQKEYIYGVSGLLATIEPITGTRYVTTDRLGTPRIVTTNVGEVVSRHDYQPFGEELFAGMGNRTTAQSYNKPTDTLRQRFTGKERDNETGLDYFQARYRQDSHVLPESAMVPDKNIIKPAPNRFTHELTRARPFYFDGAQQGRPPDGELPAGAKVVLLVYDGGLYCRVADGRGLYVEVEYDALRRLPAGPGEVA